MRNVGEHTGHNGVIETMRILVWIIHETIAIDLYAYLLPTQFIWEFKTIASLKNKDNFVWNRLTKSMVKRLIKVIEYQGDCINR